LLLAISSFVFLLSACSEGPAEQAGKKIDNAATDIQNNIEDACENVKDKLNTDNQDC
jgi:hypothetical protein